MKTVTKELRQMLRTGEHTSMTRGLLIPDVEHELKVIVI